MNQSIKYNFPATTFVASNTLQQQLRHVLSEMNEVRDAIRNNEGTERIDEELADVYHSLETYFRRMQLDLGAEYVDALFDIIEDKNRDRNYYGDNPA